MKQNFNQALAWVLQAEGGNDDDHADHGGRTSRGITQREYDAWCHENDIPAGDVWKAPQGHVETIYHDEYWLPYCDDFQDGIDYLFFDMAVNAGPHRATILLQRAVGVVADGRIGPITRQAVAAADPQSLIARYTSAKREFYRELHQPRFLNGWLNRATQVQANAQTLIGA